MGLLPLLVVGAGCSLLVEGDACQLDVDCAADTACVEGFCVGVDGETRTHPEEGPAGAAGAAGDEASSANEGGDEPERGVDGEHAPPPAELPADGVRPDPGEGGNIDNPGAGTGTGDPPGDDPAEGPAVPTDCGLLDADEDGWSACEDCDDSRPGVHPGAAELCNARDDDCDGDVDEPCPSWRPGWPVDLGAAVSAEAGLAIGDLDGTPTVIVSTDKGVHALSANGTARAGFPFAPADKFVTPPTLVDLAPNALGPQAAGEGTDEVVVADNSGAVFALTRDGATVEGWPARLSSGPVGALVAGRLRGGHAWPHIAAAAEDRSTSLLTAGGLVRQGRWPLLTGGKVSGVALADLDGDGVIEVIVSTEGAGLLAVLETGVIAAGFPALVDERRLRSPAVDLGVGGGATAIWVTDESRSVHRVDRFGRPYPGWPVEFEAKPAGLALADLDGDGRAEGVIGDDDGRVHVLDHTGGERPGWPADLGGKILGEPAVADFGDGIGYGVVVATDAGEVHALTDRAEALPGWPVSVEGKVRGGATVGDLDDNGRADVVVVTDGGRVYAWELGPGTSSPHTSHWPTPRGNPQRTGVWRR